jgi:hypothetical protein
MALSRPSSTWIALLTILTVTTWLRLRLLDVPLERDEGEYAYMGQLILSGEIPYLAANSMKLPGVYYAYAAIMSLLGQTTTAIHLGLLVINLASILLLCRLGTMLLDPIAGVGSAAAYAVLSLSATVAGFAANAEHFVVLSVLPGFVLLASRGDAPDARRTIAAGLLLGLAFVMKQHAAAFVAAGGLWVVSSGLRVSPLRAISHGAVYALGALGPFVCVGLGMWLAGAFEPYWFWTVTYAREYAAMVPLDIGLAQLAREAGRLISAAPLLWGLAAIGLIAPGWDLVARRTAPFVGLFLIAALTAVSTGLRFSDHYFLLVLPAASLLVGIAASAADRRVPRLGLVMPLVAAFAAVLQDHAYFFSLGPTAVARAVNGSNPFPEAVEIGRWLGAHAAPDDRVAVIGSEPEIYFHAQRRAATTYLYTYPLMEPHPFARRMQDEMIAQVEHALPRFVVLVNVDTSWSRRPDSSTRIFEWSSRFVEAHYRPVGLVEIVPGQESRHLWGTDLAVTPRSSAYVMTFERRP